ncbi:NAD(P)/FAD-dependent oxidoreductase [Reichenbachiella ulvae]|uniref:NAD(P)/FAD-dependent oxidoreductase n=1 Tax=Reichenbachiella ulvae TaxID=2980104 RepID=A0ABT3CWV0_9BACT|nr:NAD(P)/FAD-dependent oxidoreductase [Reichenbachiella ulvae]MCV9388181.1 NAD(P)/FAD-dependent oxidoreductase [Reichenbachiella ulvae]
MRDVIIIGGGLAGLVNATLLSRSGLDVLLIEKKNYPFHRVCGEYISNEVRPFLETNALFPKELNPAEIKHFSLSSISGKTAEAPLGLGGFGISRYDLDQFLFEQAKEAGAEVLTGRSVQSVRYEEEDFFVAANKEILKSRLVIGAFGKRSALDREMDRDFMKRRSPYLGVKYHIKTDLPKNLIALHNFKNGYCGLSSVGGDTYNLCYLSHRDNLKDRSVAEMEAEILHRNSHLKAIWENSDFLFDQPIVINEISFEKKGPLHDHIFMSGDTAGMITPLCGNGMAMAIRSAYLLSGLILANWNDGKINRARLEKEYVKEWNKAFSQRLWVGRQFQKLFGSEILSEWAVGLVKKPAIASRLIAASHGKPFS